MRNMIGIAFRVITYRAEIMEQWDRLAPLLRGAMKAYPDIVDLICKIAPELIDTTAEQQTVLASDGVSVAWLQRSLNTLSGAGLDVDGEYGEATRAAVRVFQERVGLPVDGWAGVGTSAAIHKELEERESAS